MEKQMKWEPEKSIGIVDDESNLTTQETLTDEKWQAIIHNDHSYDGHFFYAVKTTGIFCRPSCKSRPPKRENICLFRTADEALSANFRPCKRCKPTGQRLPDEEWVALVNDYIDKNYMEHLTLNLLAERSHGSPYHLHRTFKRIKGITPVECIQQKRIEQAKYQLVTTDKSIAEIGQSVGLSNTPYFVTLFKKKTGYTLACYRQMQNEIRSIRKVENEK
ncbi:bifunctional transcriptional activator/DNA repair enzyme AdaA [Paenibacillus sediminis]|uniref:AraC family transcriptional regulator of adaptative response / methylphosphotriester-DNA alkyltransferase methyltransferase n=1 Tax=Paenibacillus sediminis TaxID=664909 RepID=A0ABS4H0M4_9BACL|nr:bifunctional transcriptional activator/DNA repair enzyme AdaA [Paenibacillus sediminis]MBP1936074.1 AraC family transcriptional regulator of adaptative response / methylphosphotriester-DNA alkyltransferase methyltransferase [Paenibacillus sediminis]